MSDTGAPIKCLGCEWDGYTHSHIDAEDGPRSTCCDHSCGRPNTFPTARLAWDASVGDLRVVEEPTAAALVVGQTYAIGDVLSMFGEDAVVVGLDRLTEPYSGEDYARGTEVIVASTGERGRIGAVSGRGFYVVLVGDATTGPSVHHSDLVVAR